MLVHASTTGIARLDGDSRFSIFRHFRLRLGHVVEWPPLRQRLRI